MEQLWGSDHKNGGTFDAKAVVPTGTYNDNPTPFNVIFPAVSENSDPIMIQMGANAGQTMNINLFSY